MRFVGTLARRALHALGGARGGQRSTVVPGAHMQGGAVAKTGPADIGSLAADSGSVLDDARRRAAEAAVIEPEETIGDDALLERFVRGRHAARQEALSARTAERIAVLEGTIAAEEDDRAAARAAADRARDEWHEDRDVVAAAAARVDAVRDDVRTWRRERNALPLRARGYVGGPLKWVLVVAVALALMPLVYLSMAYLDDPVVQILVTAAATAGIFAAEHAIGFGMAHIAQHVSRRARLAWLFVAAAVVTAAMAGAEVYAGVTREQATGLVTGGGTFDAAAAAQGAVATQPDTVSMAWTVPLGIGATIAGSLIVALYVLGGPGRELKKRIAEGRTLLAEAREDHRAAEPRAERSRASYEQAEKAAAAIAGRTARAREEIRGAELAATHARAAEDGERTSNLAAAEIAYHAERAAREERERLRDEAEARRAEQAARDDASEAHREARDDAAEAHREARDDAAAAHREARDDARREHDEERRDARRRLRDERRQARRTARRQRHAERVARVAGAARAVGAHASDGVRLGGPATTAGLLAAGLGAPAILAVAAGTGGLTAAHFLTRSRRTRPVPVTTMTTSLQRTAPAADITHVNGTSTNGLLKEHA